MSRSLRTELSRFGQGDLAVRVVGGLLGVLPFAPSWRPVPDLDARAAAIDAELGPRIAARAEALAQSPGPQSALATFDFLDKGDSGIALFSGVRGAVKVMKGQGADALEMDPQQTADAGLKAAGLAWVTWKLFEGLGPTPTAPPAADRLRAFMATEAGRALLAWYVAAELVLPFADNLAQGGTDTVIDLLESQAKEHADRLSAVAGAEVADAAGMLTQMAGTLRNALGQAAVYAGPVVEWSKTNLPGLLGAVDKATGLLATGVDTLSTYRCIGASLVAEVCLTQATTEVRAEVEAERAKAAAEREKAAAIAEAARVKAVAAAEAAREKAERDAVERAEAERIAAQARRIASAQQEKYTLDEALPAASLAAAPIKVTRSAEMEVSQAAVPAKSGCFGCGGLLLIGVLAAGALVPLLT